MVNRATNRCIKTVSFLVIIAATVTRPGLCANPADLRLKLVVYDFADIPDRDWRRAQSVVFGIFAQAGIHLGWRVGNPVEPEARLLEYRAIPAAGGCTLPAGGTELRARLILQAPDNVPLGALGSSLPCARKGVQVTIFSDRVEAVTRNAHVSYGRALGHALAHEIGHVLLRDPQHTEIGIMRGFWTRADWQRAAVELMAFDAEQAKRMQEDVLARVSFDP